MASKGVNKVILLGRLGSDPDVRFTKDGRQVVNISMATSEVWNDRDTGQKKELTEWHKVVVFGKLAEVAAEYLKKGSQVYFEGSLKTRKWTDRAGIERYSTEVFVGMNGSMQMLGSPSGNDSAPGQQHEQKKAEPQVGQQCEDDFFDDDIPF